MIVAVLLPTTGRSSQMVERVNELVKQSMPKGIDLRVFLAVPKDDEATLEMAEELWVKNLVKIVKRLPDTTAVQGWNAAFVAAYKDGAEWFVLGADDIKWHQGWLEAALEAAEKAGAQVVGLHDGHTNLSHYGAHYMAHRKFIEEELGGVFIPPVYGSWWFDREICEKAAGLGLYVPCWNAVAEHLHPDWNTAAMDETYRKAAPLHQIDQTIYETRKADGFPVDYPSLLKAAESVDKSTDKKVAKGAKKK